MDDPLVRDAIRQIQDLVAEATGQMLQSGGERRLQQVLAVLRTDPAQDARRNFSDREVSILFADLRGFAAMAASYPPGSVIGVLNRCFTPLAETIVSHRGTIDRFMGDALMAVFAGDPREPREHARRALACAVEMQIAMNDLRTLHREENVPEMYMGIGVNTGAVAAGLIGSQVYRTHTVIGAEVNLAARIEAFALRGQVLMSESTWRHAGPYALAGEPVEVFVKGRRDKVRVRELLGIPSLGRQVPRQEIRRSPRVEVRLPFRYQRMEGKTVAGEPARGMIHDIGYHGLLAETDAPLEPLAEVKLAVELLDVSRDLEDVYARVVKVTRRGEAWFAGMEFTSLSAAAGEKIRLFVQMTLQS